MPILYSINMNLYDASILKKLKVLHNKMILTNNNNNNIKLTIEYEDIY